MPPRLKARLEPPILFAHRGGNFPSQNYRENSLEAFQASLEMGKRADLADLGFMNMGIESDARITQDGIVVLSHGPKFGFLRRRISKTQYQELPDWIVRLEEVFENIAAKKMNFDFSLDIKEKEAFEKVLEIAKRMNIPTKKLWVCFPDFKVLTEWKKKYPEANLIHSTSISRLQVSPEKHLNDLAEANISGFNLHHSEYSGGLASLIHRFELLAFGWGANQIREILELLDLGIDGIYSDHPELLLAGLKEIYG